MHSLQWGFKLVREERSMRAKLLLSQVPTPGALCAEGIHPPAAAEEAEAEAEALRGTTSRKAQ